jgi:hypothetical protein
VVNTTHIPYSSFDEAIDEADSIGLIAKRATLTATTDGELTDILGVLKKETATIMEVRRGAAVELEPGTVGERYEYKQGKVATRTYNDTGLLMAFNAMSDESPLMTLARLLNMGVVKMSWQWRVLESAARERELELRTMPGTVQDGDPDYLVGETWKATSPDYLPVRHDEE